MFGFFKPQVNRMRVSLNSLTIWKADINIGIYMVFTISKGCRARYF